VICLFEQGARVRYTSPKHAKNKKSHCIKNELATVISGNYKTGEELVLIKFDKPVLSMLEILNDVEYCEFRYLVVEAKRLTLVPFEENRRKYKYIEKPVKGKIKLI
jgi:hypothetical protein